MQSGVDDVILNQTGMKCLQLGGWLSFEKTVFLKIIFHHDATTP